MNFGSFEENILSKTCLGFFMTKDPPAVMKKEFFRSAQRRRVVAARESSACEVDPQHGPTSKALIERKKLLLKQATIELQARSFDEKLKSDEAWERDKGVRKDFQVIDRAWQQWA